MAGLKYLGGHPQLLKTGTVSLRNVGPNLQISAGRTTVAIPGEAIVGVRLERNYRRSAGGAAGGAILGGVLLGPIGALGGAAIGGRRQDDSVIVLTTNIDGLNTDIVFVGKDILKQYASIAAIAQKAKSYWPTRLNELIGRLERARHIDSRASEQLLSSPSGYGHLLEVGISDPVRLEAQTKQLAEVAKAREEFIGARKQLLDIARTYMKVHSEAGTEAAKVDGTGITLDEVNALSNPVAREEALLQLERDQVRDLTALAKSKRGLERAVGRLERQENTQPLRQAAVDQWTARVNAQRANLQQELNALALAWSWIRLQTYLIAVWLTVTWLHRHQEQIEQLREVEAPRLREAILALTVALRERTEELERY